MLWGTKLNCRAHFRWLIEVWTGFEAFRSNIDLIGGIANIVRGDFFLAWRVNITQADLKKEREREI
jgi:hypothetical protein